MPVKTIKKLFYALFLLDILAGIAVGFILSAFAGIVTAAVLLVLNITVFIMLLKMSKITEGKNGQN